MAQLKTKAQIALLRGKLAAYEGKEQFEDLMQDMRSSLDRDGDVISEDTKADVNAYVDQIQEQLRDGGEAARQKIGELLDTIEEKLGTNQ